jgi:hypothetical protein
MLQSNNKLINNHQQQRKAQNNLLQNNNTASSIHAQQMQQMYHIKQQNQNQGTLDKDKLKEILIKPIKLEKANTAMIDKVLKDEEDKRKPKLEDYWKNRTNISYKGILKNENPNLKITTKDDLIVHRVTKEDKNAKEIENKYQDINEKIQTHNGELKVIYATSKEREHKKKFEYTHIYQYRKTDLNNNDDEQQDHDKLRQERFNFYKEQQKKQEKNKNKLDSILDKLVNDGIFSQDELNGLDTKNINNNTKPDITSKKQMYLDRKNNKQ